MGNSNQLHRLQSMTAALVGVFFFHAIKEGRARKRDVLRGGPAMSNNVPGRLAGHGEHSNH
jgi:hypothetical protein